MDRRVSLGLLLGFIGVVIFGATLPMTRLALSGLNPWFIAFGRAALAGLLALAVVLALRRPWPFRRPGVLRDLALSSLGLIFGFPLLMSYASLTVPASHAGVVLGLLPLGTTLAATALAGERPSWQLFAASFVGAALILTFVLRNGGAGEFGTGDMLLLLSVVVTAMGYALSGRLARQMAGWEVIAFMLVLSLPGTLLGTALSWPEHPEAVTLPAWGAFVYLALMSQFVGFLFWNAGLAMGGISRVAQVQLLQTFVTVALAWPVNGEVPDLETVAFAVAVVAVVAFARRAKIRPAKIQPVKTQPAPLAGE